MAPDTLQASVSIAGVDVQHDVTDVFRRTGAVMAGLRQTIWDEYYTLMQVAARHAQLCLGVLEGRADSTEMWCRWWRRV